MNNGPELSPGTFDRVTAGRPAVKVWGAPAIARILGVSVDTVYQLAKDPKSPVYKPSGYFAYRNELEAWLRTKP
ncbi:hypothetical protein [Consotaella aegiceratis]|uniref:hypothetical protein n=1 Tax=Consotaella aegiceratis TaxID=3097961 RepID=UPI002F41F512